MTNRRPPFKIGAFYHVYNRGVAKQRIFHDESDFQFLLDKTVHLLDMFDITLTNYNYLANHYHYILCQSSGKHTITEFMRSLMTSYAMRFNKKYSRVGPVFQGRFNAKEITNPKALLYIARYVDRNYAEAYKKLHPQISDEKFLQILHRYKWSSFGHYMKGTGSFLSKAVILSSFSGNSKERIDDYRAYVEARASRKT